MNTRSLLGSAAAAIIAGAAPAGWGSAPSQLEVRWIPERPVEGSAVQIVARPPGPAVRLRGQMAGEPLHFDATADGELRAVGGIPIGRRDSIAVDLVVIWPDGGTDLPRVYVPVSAGEYRHERLSVAPRFGRAPDAATAARIQREAERAREVSRGSHHTSRLWQEPFVLPRRSRITSGFGHGREFNGVVRSRHMGVDFAGAVGEPVRSTNRGVAALVADFHLAGTAVYLDHGAGLVTGYFHLSRADVAEGDTVTAGQVIGRVGRTGRVTGPHLHWIARYGTITIDPLSLPGIEGAGGTFR